MVLHKPYPIADETSLVVADHDRKNLQTLAASDATSAFEKMKSSALKNGIGLIAFSAYRSPARQKELFIDAQRRHGRRRAAMWVAPPGYSEHQTGLAFDIGDRDMPDMDDEPTFEATPAYAWLRERAAEFGFELSFPSGNFQGVSYEPWHWRFVGSPTARSVFHPPFVRKISIFARAFTCALKYQILS